jgi:hypothetical protein
MNHELEQLRRKYFTYEAHEKNMGTNRTSLKVRCVLRPGCSYSDYLCEMRETLPHEYGVELCHQARFSFNDGTTTKSAYRQRIMDLKRKWGLTNSDIKPFLR